MSQASAPEALRLDRLAGLVAVYRFVEHRLFQLTGAWAPVAGPPALGVYLDRVSAEHAWHAELWAERQPLPPHLASVVSAPPPPALARLLDELAALGPAPAASPPGPGGVPLPSGSPAGPGSAPAPPGSPTPTGPSVASADSVECVASGGGLAVLAALARVVLPRLVVTYRGHLRRTVEVTDGPEIRVLRLVLADEVEAWHDGEALVQQLATGPASLEVACRACAWLEEVLAGGAAGPGLVAWPEGGDAAPADVAS